MAEKKQRRPRRKNNDQKKPTGQDTTLTEEITKVLEEVKAEPVTEKKKGETVTLLEDGHLTIGQREYILVKNHREAFDSEKLAERFSDILSKYDYIVGDWGYEQLRLRGFFDKEQRKAAPDQRIDTLEDYLYEYCNFGCAYFVLEKVNKKREKTTNKRKRTNRKNTNQNAAHVAEKRQPVTGNSSKPVIKRRKETPKNTQPTKKTTKSADETRSFVIRKREESEQ